MGLQYVCMIVRVSVQVSVHALICACKCVCVCVCVCVFMCVYLAIILYKALCDIDIGVGSKKSYYLNYIRLPNKPLHVVIYLEDRGHITQDQ